MQINAATRLLADWWSSLSREQKERSRKKHADENAPEERKLEPQREKPVVKDAPVKPVKGKAAHKAASAKLDEKEVQALKEYTGSMYTTVNPLLRAGKPVSKEDRNEVKLVDEAFKKAKTTEPIEVYRGISGDFYSGLKDGDVFEDKGFVSTSTDLDTADNFARGDAKAIMKVQVPKGSRAISVDSLSVFKKGGAAVRSENEILLDRGGKFKVISIKPGKGNQPKIITVEYSDA
jgi:hypothetical protein